MSPRTFFVGLLALVCGVSASVGVNRLRQSGAKVTKPETVVIPVSGVAIKRGDVVTEKMLIAREWPKDLVPAGALLTKKDIVGKIAKVSFVKNEPFFSGKIGDSPRFSGLVKDGMRASTILTPNDSSFVAGLMEPGDKVDVLFTDSTDKDLTGGGSTAPIMQNIEVLAIGQIVDPDESRANNGKRMRSVTLSVLPEQATKLVLAQEMGTLHLALRSARDEATANLSAVTVTELRGTAYPALPSDPSEPKIIPISADESAEPIAPKQPREIYVRVIRGAFKSTARLQKSPGEGSVYVEDDAAGSATEAPMTPTSAP
jgi:pilus assembly protein CpaB